MTTPTNIELISAALIDLRDVMDYVAAESGDCDILNWLKPVEEKIETVINRYAGEDDSSGILRLLDAEEGGD
jgi:hypothetical protein